MSSLAASDRAKEKAKATPTLYEITNSESGRIDLASNWSADSSISRDYTNLFTLDLAQEHYLVCYSRDSGTADAFEILSANPYFRRTTSKLSFEQGYDALEPFVLGNRQYVLSYKQSGQFSFTEVREDLSLSEPFRFIHSRDPGMSVGFTMVKPIVCLGAVYVMGYNFETGNAVLYSLNVTARSFAPDAPALSARHVWRRSWSPGWTRFAFFTFGGENFFLKTNTVRPNVNIDHVCDDPSDGAVPIATRVKLENAQNLKICQSFALQGEPYFAAYASDGTTVLYRFHGDCQGFTPISSCPTISEARCIVPIITSESKSLLYY